MEEEKLESAPEKEEKKKKRWLLLLLLLLLLLIFGSTGVWALFFSGWNDPAPEPPINESSTSDSTSGNPENTGYPDSTTNNPGITSDGNSNNSDTSSVTSNNSDNRTDSSDASAVTSGGNNTDPDNQGDQEVGGNVSLTYAKEVSINLTEKTASLVFGNPSRSNREAIVQLVIQDNLILQSDTIAPGTQVTELKPADGAEEKLTAGVYEGKFVVYFYDRESNRWATLNAEIPVTVTVTT